MLNKDQYSHINWTKTEARNATTLTADELQYVDHLF